MELSYDCYVKGWNLYIKDRNLFNEEIKTLDESKEYVITIKKKQKIRSNGQNRYYFGIVLPLVLRGLRNAGFDVQEYAAKSRDDSGQFFVYLAELPRTARRNTGCAD